MLIRVDFNENDRVRRRDRGFRIALLDGGRAAGQRSEWTSRGRRDGRGGKGRRELLYASPFRRRRHPVESVLLPFLSFSERDETMVLGVVDENEGGRVVREGRGRSARVVVGGGRKRRDRPIWRRGGRSVVLDDVLVGVGRVEGRCSRGSWRASTDSEGGKRPFP